MREKKIFTQFFVIISCFLIFDISLITIGHVKDPSQWFGFLLQLGTYQTALLMAGFISL